MHPCIQPATHCTQAHCTSPGNREGASYSGLITSSRLRSCTHCGGCKMCHTMCEATPSENPGEPKDDQCHWKGLLNEDQQIFVSDLNLHTGFVTIFLSMWVTATVLSSKKLRNDRFYCNLLNYTISAIARNLVAIATSVYTASSCGSCDDCDMSSCKMLATVDTFLSVYEFESLTQLCIARFINAFYTVNVWEIPAWHNSLFPAISVILGALYSAMPFLGIGRYERDFDCIHCTYDVIMPQRKLLQVAIIAIFLLKHVKPVVFMQVSLWFARGLEVKKISGRTLSPTKGLLFAVIATLIFSLPMFLLRASVLVKQLFNSVTPQSNDMVVCFAIWAISLNLVATPVAIVSLALGDERLASKMGNLMCRRDVDDEAPAPGPAPAPPSQLKQD